MPFLVYDLPEPDMDDDQEATAADLNRDGAILLIQVPEGESSVTLQVPLSVLTRVVERLTADASLHRAAAMTATGYHRGHAMRIRGRCVAGTQRRACWCQTTRSQRAGTAESRLHRKRHDGCLGTLPGVVNACCGHGTDGEAYVSLDDGRRLAGLDALGWIDRARN